MTAETKFYATPRAHLVFTKAEMVCMTTQDQIDLYFELRRVLCALSEEANQLNYLSTK